MTGCEGYQLFCTKARKGGRDRGWRGGCIERKTGKEVKYSEKYNVDEIVKSKEVD